MLLVTQMHVFFLASIGVFGDRQGVAFPIHERMIFRTAKNIAALPIGVHAQEQTYARGFFVEWSDDAECERFIEENAGKAALRAYKRWPSGANRADIWRYLKLYIHGGIYIDEDVVLRAPLDTIFTDQSRCYSALSRPGHRLGLFQAILACPPKHPVMLQLFIQMIMHTPLDVASRTTATVWAAKVLGENNVPLRPGVHRGWTLFQENCVPGNDKYGLHCTVVDNAGKTLFFSR